MGNDDYPGCTAAKATYGSQKNKEDGDEEEGFGPVATALVDALRQVVASQFTSVILTC